MAADVGGRARRLLTCPGIGQLAWAPDDAHIFFLKSDQGKANLWRLPVKSSRPAQVTFEEGDIEFFRISPDGTAVAFLMTVQIGKATPERHLFIQSLRQAKGSPRRYTPPGASVGDDYFLNLDWSPDGKSIVLVRQKTSRADDWLDTEIVRVNIKANQIETLIPFGRAHFQPSFSPDGSKIAYIASPGRGSWFFEYNVEVLDPESRGVKRLATTMDQYLVKLFPRANKPLSRI